jgi:hypothetical protein
MTCKVITIKGENAEKFNKEAKKVGQSAALRNVVEGEVAPKIIPGFLSVKEQENRINSIVAEAFTNLKSQLEVPSILSLNTEDVKAQNLRDAFEYARERYENLGGALNSIIAKKQAKNEDVSQALAAVGRIEVVLENFDELKLEAVKRFRSLGYAFDASILDMTEEELEEKEHIYDQNHFERSIKDSMSSEIKIYLSTMPKLNTAGEVVRDDLGFPELMKFHDIFPVLAMNLAGSNSLNEMIERMQGLTEAHPNLAKVINDLRRVDAIKDNATYNGRKTNNFAAAFETTFKMQYINFVSLIERSQSKTVDGKKTRVKDVRVADTNKRSLPRTIRTQWAQANADLRKFSSMEALQAKAPKVKEAYLAIIDKYRKQFDDLGNRSTDKTVINLFQQIGITLTPAAVQAWQMDVANQGKRFSDELTIYANRLVDKHFRGEDIFGELDDSGAAESEGTSIRKLANFVADTKIDKTVGSFVNGANSLIYAVNLNHSVSNMISELKKDNSEVRERMSNDPMLGSLDIIKKLENPTFRKEFELNIFDTVFDNDSSREGVGFGSLDPVRSMASKLNMFLNYRGGNRRNSAGLYGYYFVPTPADRGNSAVVKLKKLDSEGSPFSLATGMLKTDTQFYTWLTNTIDAEFARIKKVREEYANTEDKNSLITNYHTGRGGKLGNGGWFNLYPELNQFLEFNEDGTVANEFKADSGAVHTVLSSLVKDQVEADVQYLVDLGLITKKDEVTYEANENTKDLFHQTGATQPVTYGNIQNFIVNYIYSNHELSTLFSGDMALYKTTDFESYYENQGWTQGRVNQQTQFADINKRSGLPYTPGSELSIASTEFSGGANPTFNVAVGNDQENKSLYFDEYKALLGKDAAMYDRNNITDAQGFITLDRYADILRGLGQLTPEVAQIITDLKNGKSDPTVIGKVLQPLKGFYYAQEYSEDFKRVVPFNLKYSSIPLIPALYNNNPKLKNLAERMERAKADEYVFETGIKVGIYNTNETDSEADLKTITLHNKHWRMPLVVPYKSKIEDNFGSQMRKLISNNLKKVDPDGNPVLMNVMGNSLSMIAAQNEYQQAIYDNLVDSYNNIVKQLKTGDSFDEHKVAKKILEDLEKNAYVSMSETFEEALAPVEVDGVKTTRVPMSYPSIAGRVQSTLNSMFRKNVTKQKMPGFSAVQYSSYGEVNVDDSLKFVRLGKRNDKGELVEVAKAKSIELAEKLAKGELIDSEYELMPAQVKVSPQYFLHALRKKVKTIVAEKNKKDLVFEGDSLFAVQENEEWAKLMNFLTDKNGNLSVDKIKAMDPRLLNMVIYRIPTQAKNSALPVEIVEFTPEEMGSVICIPSEITTQSGSDYDIDKVFVETYNFDITADGLKATDFIHGQENGKAARQNLITGFHYGILTHPTSYKELITPNGSETLKSLRDSLTGQSGGMNYWNSMRTQEVFRDNNKAGKDLIGVASIANTFHSFAQDIDVQLKSETVINGSVIKYLHNQNAINGKLISDELAEIQTAAVDNAKDPVLGDLNVNLFTSGPALFLVQAGLGLEYTMKLINQQVIKDLTRHYHSVESTLGSTGAMAYALKQVNKDYQTTVSSKNWQEITGDVSINDLNENLENNELTGMSVASIDQKVLSTFLMVKEIGDNLGRVSNYLAIDTKGTTSSVAGNLVRIKGLETVGGSVSHGEVSHLAPNTNKYIEINGEKYQNHSNSAFEKYGLNNPTDVISNFVDDASPVFREVVNRVSELSTKTLTEREIKLAINDFYTYLFANTNAFNGELDATVHGKTSDAKRFSLVQGENSLARRLQRYHRENIGNENAFLAALSVRLDDKKSGLDVVTFNNTISSAMDESEKTELSNSFFELISSKASKEERLLALDLFRYAFISNGFAKGPNSFMDYVPVEMHEKLGLIDFYRNISKSFDNTSKFEIGNFVELFVRNNFASLSFVPTFERNPEYSVEDQLNDNKDAKYFKMVSGKGVKLYRRVGDTNRYSSVESLGFPNQLKEYGTGDSIMSKANIAKLQEQLTKTDIVADNKNC